MKQIRVTIDALITLPEGTIVPEQGRAFTLPSGDWVKPFIVMELNDDRDLPYSELIKLNVDIDEENIEWFEEGVA
jgi:hypothetical protein